MTSWISWGSSPFDEMVEKATSELNIADSEDIALNLEICDQIRSKAVQPKDAMRSLKRRLNHQNPNVQLLTLSLLDTCVKNGGDHFLVEVASREFMDNLVSILKLPAINREVRERMAKLIQTWALAFAGKSTLSYVDEVYKTLQREGFKFPPKDAVVANSAMVDTSTAPEWIDSEWCLRCRTPFSFTNRKHHCRNCGKVYDQACSSKALPLPHFGIAEPVRVCDACFVLLKKKNDRGGDAKVRRTQSHSTPRPPKPKTPREVADEELQRAIALSLEESRPNQRPGYVAATSSSWPGASEPPAIDQSARPTDDEEDDPELRAAIEASLRDVQAPQPSAPSAADDAEGPVQIVAGNELQPLESDAILTFSQTVQDAAARGTRDLVRYPGFGELFERANTLEPKMSTNLGESAEKEQELTDMHEKLSEIVKLYDRILTEQVNNPARRYGQYASQYTPTLQQATRASTMQHYAPQAPNQWNAPQQPTWNIPQQTYSAVPSTPAPQQSVPYSYGQPAVASTPVQQQYTGYSLPPVTLQHPQQQQYAAPVQYAAQPMSPPQQSVQAPPPPPIQYVASQATGSTYAPEPIKSPPPAPVAQVHNPPPPPPQNSHVYQQPAVQLPHFPSAPTVVPQPYIHSTPVYEPKEAMLISFD